MVAGLESPGVLAVWRGGGGAQDQLKKASRVHFPSFGLNLGIWGLESKTGFRRVSCRVSASRKKLSFTRRQEALTVRIGY